MLTYERSLWEQGYTYVAGVDEAGRGCLYGDVVAACVLLPPGLEIPGVDDSKKLTPAKREALYQVIVEQALAIGIGRVEAPLIDELNIKQATRLAMRRAVLAANHRLDHLLVDAERVEMAIPQTSLIRGDARSHSIACASIVAKVTRDRDCLAWEERDPGYGIAQHKGYPTAFHRERVRELGPSPHHRRSFLRKVLA